MTFLAAAQTRRVKNEIMSKIWSGATRIKDNISKVDVECSEQTQG
jgi:hypothetical protein